MPPSLGTPRTELIDLLTSKVGQMVARRIDAAHGYADCTPQFQSSMRARVEQMAKLVHDMSRDQLEDSHRELNSFFRMVPFSEAIPVVIEIELKWPHHIETIREANQRLDVIRRGGELALMFDEQKLADVVACIQDIERRR